MTQTSIPKRPLGIYLLIIWMLINTALFMLMIPNDSTDLNNYIELILWIASIAGLLSMKKAGVAFATSVFGITIGTSNFNVLVAYYTGFIGEPVAYINGFRIIINAIALVYLFKAIFADKFR